MLVKIKHFSTSPSLEIFVYTKVYYIFQKNLAIFHIQWGDSEEIDWPQDLDHSGAIDISGGGSGSGITAYSLTQNGYVVFDCGLIIQWGYVTPISNYWAITITFPIQFHSKIVYADCSQDASNAPNGSHTNMSDSVRDVWLNEMKIEADAAVDYYVYPLGMYWLAIGY